MARMLKPQCASLIFRLVWHHSHRPIGADRYPHVDGVLLIGRIRYAHTGEDMVPALSEVQLMNVAFAGLAIDRHLHEQSRQKLTNDKLLETCGGYQRRPRKFSFAFHSLNLLLFLVANCNYTLYHSPIFLSNPIKTIQTTTNAAIKIILGKYKRPLVNGLLTAAQPD